MPTATAREMVSKTPVPRTDTSDRAPLRSPGDRPPFTTRNVPAIQRESALTSDARPNTPRDVTSGHDRVRSPGALPATKAERMPPAAGLAEGATRREAGAPVPPAPVRYSLPASRGPDAATLPFRTRRDPVTPATDRLIPPAEPRGAASRGAPPVAPPSQTVLQTVTDKGQAGVSMPPAATSQDGNARRPPPPGGPSALTAEGPAPRSETTQSSQVLFQRARAETPASTPQTPPAPPRAEAAAPQPPGLAPTSPTRSDADRMHPETARQAAGAPGAPAATAPGIPPAAPPTRATPRRSAEPAPQIDRPDRLTAASPRTRPITAPSTRLTAPRPVSPTPAVALRLAPDPAEQRPLTLDGDSPRADPGAPLSLGDSPQAASEALRLSASATRPDILARHVAAQLAQAAGRAAQAPTELRLDPKELGRVTLRLATDETGVTLHVTAERAETTELMRRHISMLEESYRSLGYERVEIAINGRQTGGAGDPGAPRDGPPQGKGPVDTDPADGALADGTAAPAHPATAAPVFVSGGDRVDLRL